MNESYAIPDWRKNSDHGIVIVAPKVSHLRKNIGGYTCGLCGGEPFGLGTDIDFKIHSDGKLGVMYKIIEIC